MDHLKLEYRHKKIPYTSIESPTRWPTPPTIASTHNSSHSLYYFEKCDPAKTKAKNINTVCFLKYVNLRLRDKDGILMLYRDVYQQGRNYNIHINKIENITNVSNATVPTTLPDPSAISVTADCLCQKLKQNKVTDDDINLAYNLLNTTTNGFEYLFQLLRLVYTNLMVKSSATQSQQS